MEAGEYVTMGWSGPSFAHAVQGKTQKLKIYTGAGEEDITDDLSIADVIQPLSEGHERLSCLIVDIPRNDYCEFWKPWSSYLNHQANTQIKRWATLPQIDEASGLHGRNTKQPLEMKDGNDKAINPDRYWKSHYCYYFFIFYF